MKHPFALVLGGSDEGDDDAVTVARCSLGGGGQ
jgi:hypothetical protein